MEKRTKEGMEKKRNYINDYNKKNTIVKTIRLHNVLDKDILTHLKKQSNFAGYVKELIREDIKKEG